MKKFSSTKKASFPRNSLRKPTLRLAVGGVLVLLLSALLLPSIFSFIGKVLLAPMHVMAVWVRESPAALPAYLRDRSALLQKQAELQAQLDERSGLELSVQRLLEENIALRSHYGEGPSARLLTRIVARPPFLPYDLLQIDKGSRDGVEVGAPVFAGYDVVVGVVVEVGDAYAFVELVSSPNFEATVYVPSANAFVPMEGMGAGVSRLRFPQGVRIVPGDIVVLPAYDGGVYGEVTHIESAPTQPEQYGYLMLPVGLQRMHYLTAGKKPVAPRLPEEIAIATEEIVRRHFLVPELHQFVLPTSTEEGIDEVADIETSTTTP